MLSGNPKSLWVVAFSHDTSFGKSVGLQPLKLLTLRVTQIESDAKRLRSAVHFPQASAGAGE
jgi:hypothetical protein